LKPRVNDVGSNICGALHCGDFLRALGGGAVGPSLLEDMLDVTRSEKAARSWEELVRWGLPTRFLVSLPNRSLVSLPTRSLVSPA
jgi:hypothetical protein